ncbi:glutamate-cysteine ligase family protein [Halogranum rubrum]|nr:glutamate-cysteine ligase family protein [Halogranum salarium]
MSEHPHDNRSPNRTEPVSRSTSSDPIRRSIEVEYWVIDEDGRLTEPGDLVEAAPGVEREFTAPLLEIKTTPCETTAELREELFSRLRSVLREAEKANKGLVPLATPAQHGPIEDRPSERTRVQDRVLGEQFEYVRHCAGTHIHVEQQPGRKIDQLNTFIALDPALALVNSSPYFRGSQLADGARSQLYRWMAYEHLPRQGRLWPYVDDNEDWARRIERRYGEFVTRAVFAGFDRGNIEASFDPEGAVWTPVQLRERFSTVEWRSPDTALPSEIIRLADEITDVVERLNENEVRIEGDEGRVTDDAIVLPRFDAVEEYVEASIRDGLASEEVRSYLDRMGFDVSAFEPLSREMDTESLSVEEARELRLEYAERLKEDVQITQPMLAD